MGPLLNKGYIVDLVDDERQVIERTLICPNCSALMMPLNMKKTSHYCFGCGSLFHSN